jgi:hypothetical protein
VVYFPYLSIVARLLLTFKTYKMKKTYKFSVDVETTDSNTSFIDGLIDEVTDEKKQLVLTHKINKETTKMHREILLDLADEMNEQLGKVGLKFDDFQYEGNNNHYKYSMCKAVVDNRSFVLIIKGSGFGRFEGSKYSTFTGEYNLSLAINSSPYYTANQRDEATTVKDIADIFGRMEHWVKEHIHKINKVEAIAEKF